MTAYYLAGQRLSLRPDWILGSGGEADVYGLPDGRALKLFKPGLADPAARALAAERAAKLQQFPSGLPDRVIVPETLVTTQARGGSVGGYVMRRIANAELLLRYGERPFRDAGVSAAAVTAILRDLHASVGALHACGVVVGDFNDTNVLVQGQAAWLIDADSMQFGPFPCRTYTERFLDPLLVESGAVRPVLARPYLPTADWYAFTVMLCRLLLLVDPFGGVHQPTGGKPKVPLQARSLQRLTIFDPAIRRPAVAEPFGILPDALLDYLRRVLIHDRREPFPQALLDGLVWHRCPGCDREIAVRTCPHCHQTVPLPARPAMLVRGQVTETTIVTSREPIVAAEFQEGVLRRAARTGTGWRREDGRTVQSTPGQQQEQPLLAGETIVLRAPGRVTVVAADGTRQLLATDSVGNTPSVATNGRAVFWVEGGELRRTGRLGPMRLGDVLAGQTRLWVGPTFGLGYAQAGNLVQVYLFDTEHTGIDDRLVLPPVEGKLLRAEAAFGADRVWFTTEAQHNGVLCRCSVVLHREGRLLAMHHAIEGDGSWLGGLDSLSAAGPWAFARLGEELVRLAVVNGGIEVERRYPDATSFLTDDVRLLTGGDGLYLVTRHAIRRLTM